MGVLAGLLASAVSDLRHPTAWLVDAVSGRSTSTGERVSPETAQTIPAYFAAIRVVSEDVAKLPLIVYKRLEPRGKDRAPDHPVYRLLHKAPNPEMSSFAFREVLTQHALSWGNGYAEIVRDGSGTPTEVWPIHPSRVRAMREDGVLRYDVREDQGWVPVDPYNMLHIHGPGGDGVSGLSMAQLLAESIGVSLATQRYAAAFFGNNSSPGGILSHPTRLSPEATQNLRKSWEERHGGSANVGRVAILQEGMTWQSISIPNEDAQFLETRRFQVEEIARAFRIPPHMIGDLSKATFSNIEQQALEYVQNTLMPWLVRWEQEVSRKLFDAADDEHFAEHLVTSLLRGDQAARSAFYSTLFNIGSLSPNDIRELENMNPVEGGDEYFRPLAMQRLTDEDEEPEPETPAPMPPMQQPPPDQPEPEEDEAREARIRKGVLRVCAERAGYMVSKECKVIEAASRKRGFEDWIAAWSAGIGGEWEQAMYPHAITLAELLSDGPLSKESHDAAQGACARLCRTLAEQARSMGLDAHARGAVPDLVRAWEIGRAANAANDLVEAVAESLR